MSHRGHLALLTLSVLLLTAAAADAQPRTAWGTPDLQGIWDFRTLTPLQRPDDAAEFLTQEEAASLERETVERNQELLEAAPRRTEAGGNVGGYNNFWMDRGTTAIKTRRTSLVTDPPDGRLPELTDVGRERSEAWQTYLAEHGADSYTDRNTSDRCIVGFNAGPPITPLAYNQNMQLFQTPTHVVIFTEMVHTARIVPLDGTPRLDDGVRLWSGDSRGYWDGDTLVIESANFNAKRKWIPLAGVGGGVYTTEHMTLTERLRRVDNDTLEYTFTVTDPETWSRPWTASMPMQRTDQPLYEYACHEGNYSMEGILAGARVLELAEGGQ